MDKALVVCLVFEPEAAEPAELCELRARITSCKRSRLFFLKNPQTSNEVDRSLTHAVGLVDSISYVASHSKKSSKLGLKWRCMRGQYEQSIIIQMSMKKPHTHSSGFFQGHEWACRPSPSVTRFGEILPIQQYSASLWANSNSLNQ